MKTKVHAGQMSFFDLLDTEEVVESVDILAPQGSPETGTPYASPTGEAERISANLAALRELVGGGTDRDILSRYSGWGSFSGVFDEDNAKYADTRSSIIELIGADGYAAARAGVLDAYYTDPRVASSMWRFLYKIGFNGEMGTVLEPGCGVGVFMNGAVPGVNVTGVELDPTTAAICQRIYPDQDVIAQDYAHVRLRRNSFAGVIGNVPFGKRAPYDPEYNAGRLSIHNYFLVKSLSLLAPGGYMICLTSRFTLDSANTVGRKAIFSLADMVGAVRLPRGSHRHCAGTDVIMDIVIFRKRCAGEEPGDDTWLETGTYRNGDTSSAINAYFLSHPEQVQGTLSIGQGMWEKNELIVVPLPGALNGPLYEDIDVALDRIAEVCRPVAPLVEESTPTIVGEASDDQPIGTLVSLSDGSFGVVTTTGVEPHKCPRNQADELRQLIALRDATSVLLSSQGAGCDDDEFDVLRTKTLDMYESYVSCYGALSRRKITSNAKGTLITRFPAMGGFRSDPRSGIVFALERYDALSDTAEPTAILSERVIVPVGEVLACESVSEALTASLAYRGRVEITWISELCGISENEAIAELGQAIFYDPQIDEWVTRDEYLSGDVVTKLDIAKQAAESDAELTRNVVALSAVQPLPLLAEEIAIMPGVSWIEDTDYRQFIEDTLDVNVKIERSPSGTWFVGDPGRWSRENTYTFGLSGSSHWDGVTLFRHLLSGEPVVVTTTVWENGQRRSVTDATATLSAREKQDQLAQAFATWCFSDTERKARLVARYNAIFNRSVERNYDGSHLALPDLSTVYVPYPHQLNAIWRILSEPTCLLGQKVGAGKTLEMVAAGHELVRLGMVRCPMYVVPNHLVEQFASEAQRCYPLDKLCVIRGEDLNAKGRVEITARLATDHYDGVICSHSVFERIPLSKATLDDVVERIEREATRHIHWIEATTDKTMSVKRTEQFLWGRTQMVKRLCDHAVDAGLSFEQLGVDYLFIDEAHMYKNLMIISGNRTFASMGSERAFDLSLKIEWLREQGGKRIATFATATPVANSLAEIHTMLRFLAPDILERSHCMLFDAWLATFARTVTEVELAPEGGRFRVNTRWSKFVNVPDLIKMLRTVMIDEVPTTNTDDPTTGEASGLVCGANIDI